MDIYFNLKQFSPDSILSCIAACGRVDRAYQKPHDILTPDPVLLKQNAGITPGADPDGRNAQISQGAFECLEFLHKNTRHFSLSNTSVKDLHKRMLKHSPRDSEHRGAYRSDLDKTMQELYDSTRDALSRKDRHPLFTVALFRLNFIDLMPFITGNAQLANILSYVLLKDHGYPIVTQLLLIAKLNDPPKNISKDILTQLPDTLSHLLSKASKIKYMSSPAASPALPLSRSYLNPRRQKLLQHITRNAPLKISDIMTFFIDESRNTIKKDLLFLREKELILAKGEGRGMVYLVTGN
ncbi:MAG: hypothetical protein U9O95_03655 [Candidatus Marinimicrobia bacterium]|nr:hypothetical protein [Candidatus Neomarinimicrobiota bacterium]